MAVGAYRRPATSNGSSRNEDNEKRKKTVGAWVQLRQPANIYFGENSKFFRYKYIIKLKLLHKI